MMRLYKVKTIPTNRIANLNIDRIEAIVRADKQRYEILMSSTITYTVSNEDGKELLKFLGANWSEE
jgi:hypothetical protein